jgi:choline dehydrogenase
MMNSCEFMQVLLDCVTSGQVGARDILTSVSAAGLASGLSVPTVQQALTAGETQTLNQAKAKRAYDYIFIGSGASGSIIAGELSKTGADVLVVEWEAMIPARRSAIPVSGSTMLAVRSTGRCRSRRFLS